MLGPGQHEVLQTRAVELLYGSGVARYGSDFEIRLVSILLKRPIVVYTPKGMHEIHVFNHCALLSQIHFV